MVGAVRTGTIGNRGTLVKEGLGESGGPVVGVRRMPLDSQNHGSVIVNGGELELYLTGTTKDTSAWWQVHC